METHYPFRITPLLAALLAALCLCFAGCRSAGPRDPDSPVETVKDGGQSADPPCKQAENWFKTLPRHFNSKAARDLSIVYLFRMKKSDDVADLYTVIVDHGACKVQTGETRKPDATLTATCADWMKLTKHELSGAWAFITGRLEVDGDKELARYLEDLFFSRKSSE